MYPNPRVAALITREFVPDRAHIQEQPTMWRRFGTRWTPTVLVLSAEGKEIRRIEGFLPADDLLGQLELALGYHAADRKDWKTAEAHFETAAREYPATDAVPEGLYWAGVSRYSATHDGAELKQLRRAFQERYTDTSWARRASVWPLE